LRYVKQKEARLESIRSSEERQLKMMSKGGWRMESEQLRDHYLPDDT
jgi:hypothetical protein